MLNQGAIRLISKHCRILPIITCRPCGFTMKISSRGHRLLNYIVKRNSKTDGLGPFNAYNLNGSTTFLNAKCYTYILSKSFKVIIYLVLHYKWKSPQIQEELEKVFKKKHSCGFIFSKLCYTPIFLIHVHIFFIK